MHNVQKLAPPAIWLGKLLIFFLASVTVQRLRLGVKQISLTSVQIV